MDLKIVQYQLLLTYFLHLDSYIQFIFIFTGIFCNNLGISLSFNICYTIVVY